MMRIQVIESPLGELTAIWTGLGLGKLNFGSLSTLDFADAEVLSRSSKSLAGPRALESALSEYFSGGELSFPLAHCDWTGTPAFHLRVLERCAEIARGQTLTYGQLASSVGSPGAARAVGQAMARNRWPLIIPCHRVVGHSGRLTGYSGAGGTATKRILLDFELGCGLPLMCT